ncbi:hypothetical protein [Palleronia caenipelagi]|uniref:Uncharacterized protein n=1 Tax=Palleronia caenipelagi TaxID=2489174 RepID=A0A547QA50_9RHOB|nr:hypothetical protein [Palleronia caenipelagi]TRD23252.1 hypothetical protein FEV53_01460 [Palleronia caenipelagi]
MLSLLDLLGTLGGAILGLPGILGLFLGMMTRRWPLAMIMGGAVGLITPFLFGSAHVTAIGLTEFAISIAVGLGAGALGCLIRHKGATV